jgi:hypothetical protein
MADDHRIPLPLLPGEFRRMGANPVAPYRILLTAAMDARIPADRVNGRWYVERADLPQIAAALEMELPPQRGTSASKRRASELTPAA